MEKKKPYGGGEPRQGGVMGMIKRGFCLRLFAGGQPPLKRKGGKRFGLILCNLTHNPNHKIQQSQALVLRRAKQIKSMPLPSFRLSIAVFLSVAGYSPFRAIKVRVGLSLCKCLGQVDLTQ